MSKQTPRDVSPSDFWEAYECYEKHVPDGLNELERFRTDELPQKLARSIEANKDVHLSQEEVVKLMEWKLKHGQFRPHLLSLIRKNGEQMVKQTTESAFHIYLDDREEWRAALKELCKLKGVGVATGSLILSILDPQHAPFFSDELFRWLHWDEQTKPGQPKGWDRKISYVEKEYVSLVGKLKKFENERWPSIKSAKEDAGEFNALTVEKVAYVFGKERVYVGDDSELPAAEGAEEDWSTDGAKNPTQGGTRAGNKRKSATTDAEKDEQVSPKRAKGKAKVDAEFDIPNLTPSQITPLEIGKLVARFQERQVSPEMRELEDYCLKELIKVLQVRRGTGSSAKSGGFMTLEELAKLTEWKININPDDNRDQFRTTKLDLLRTAGDDSFEQSSAYAFNQWSLNSWTKDPTHFVQSLSLKSVDASTAALVLALLEPKQYPFCTPELYRWLHWEDEPKGKSKTRGWQRRVGHTLKEYKNVCTKTHMLQKRLKRANGGRNIAALHIWMAAYMLASEKVDVDGEIAEEGTWRSFIEYVDEEDDDMYSSDSDYFHEDCERKDQVIENGPHGPPVYDRLGYELSYDKIAAAMGIGGRRPRSGRPDENWNHRGDAAYERMMRREAREDKRKAEIMGMHPNKVSGLTDWMWKDRISKDLEIPWHKVEFEHFEEWYAKGFRPNEGDFDTKNLSKKERKRLDRLACGSAFRK